MLVEDSGKQQHLAGRMTEPQLPALAAPRRLPGKKSRRRHQATLAAQDLAVERHVGQPLAAQTEHRHLWIERQETPHQAPAGSRRDISVSLGMQHQHRIARLHLRSPRDLLRADMELRQTLAQPPGLYLEFKLTAHGSTPDELLYEYTAVEPGKTSRTATGAPRSKRAVRPTSVSAWA